MKTFVTSTILAILIIMGNNVYAQDEFYNHNKTTSVAVGKTDSINVSSYTTAEDYVSGNTQNKKENTQENSVVENPNEERRRKQDRKEFFSDIVVDVFIQTIFIVATFWH